MPRTRSIAWSELKLGVVGIVAVLMVTVLVIAVGGQGGFFWQRYPLKTQFDNVQGMKSGAIVRLSGKEVGKVSAVEFAGSRVEIVMELNKDVRSLVTTESVATIGSLSLLGEAVVDLTAASTGTALPDWAYVTSAVGGGPLGALQTTAQAGLDDASHIFRDVRAGRGTLGKLVTDEALYRDLDAFVTSATEVTRAINDGKGTLGGLAKDPAAYQSLKGSLDNLQVITERLKNGEGTLGRLMNDDALGKSLTATVADLQQLTAKLNRSDGTAGKLINEKELYTRLTDLTAHLDQVASNLNSSRGTAGLLLQDRALYENMNRAVTELRDLFADIRKDPKKFLRVSVSIF